MLSDIKDKIVVYQVFTRLFGIKNPKFEPWGSKEQNGVGKFADFSTKALSEIKNLGVTHIWFTGVLHHALIGDYTKIGISNDHPEVVKGRAGSPYAIKDYYNVNPDLAVEPEKRMEEFESLIKRCHDLKLKVIIDIVPNHVARKYESFTEQKGLSSFGTDDIVDKAYDKNNDFYYIPGEAYESPDWSKGKAPLGGNYDKETFGKYIEFPARWTGNGSRSATPDINDWYETVKVNYGVRPDGSYDFPKLPEEYHSRGPVEHVDFWKSQDIPLTWKKWKAITEFWLKKGVDGFRYDMAGMVPIHFWSYLNSNIKRNFPDSILIAELYDPEAYWDFINYGLMDFLYDKVDLYDTLRAIIEDRSDCHTIFPAVEKNHGISGHLLHFLENHDEHRIASDQFAGDPIRAFPAMVLSCCIGRGSSMIYFGQEFGENALDEAGFGDPGRTSIFDYIRVPTIQRWVNEGKYTDDNLSIDEIRLRDSYKTLLNFSLSNSALNGEFYDLHRHNSENTADYPGKKIYSFARYSELEKLFVICNFDPLNAYSFRLYLYYDLVHIWQLKPGVYKLQNIFNDRNYYLIIFADHAYIEINIEALESLILIPKIN